MRFHGHQKVASGSQKPSHKQLSKFSHSQYLHLGCVNQPVKKIAASAFFVEHEYIEKRDRRTVGNVRQMTEALFAGFRIEPRIRYSLVHQLQYAHLIEQGGFKVTIHQLTPASQQ